MSARIFSLILFWLSLAMGVSAQEMPLTGRIANAKNEAISGATIMVMPGKKQLAADVEGRFSVRLAPGTKYSFTISATGYKSKVVDEVEVSKNGDNTLNIALDVAAVVGEEVIVRSSVRKENTNALLTIQRNSASVGSGIAADFIRRTPDRNTGEVLKRVSGASIQDNKFVIVRGLGDRYNQAYINSVQLPSSEPDKKAFSFDVIPSSLVDQIIITKTAMPDLTGEFAGGLVQVTTKDIPSKNFLNVGVNFGYNTISTFKDFVSNERGKYDWISFPDGSRNLPGSFPTTAAYNALGAQPNGTDLKAEESRKLSNEGYAERNSTALPITSFNIVYGNTKRLKNNAQLGAVFSAVYRNAKNLYSVERNNWQSDGEAIFNYRDLQNKYSTSLGLLANVSYVSRKHKVSFKNLFNSFLEDNYYQRDGENFNRLQDVNLYSSFLNQRMVLSSQFEGEHQLSKGVKFNWNGGYNMNYKRQPDLRTVFYIRNLNTNNPFLMDPDDTRRFYSTLQDHSFNASGAFSFPFQLWDEKQTFKVGGSTQLRFRDFSSRIFRYVEANSNANNDDLKALPVDQIFAAQNISSNGFILDDFTNPDDKYFGIASLNAGYAMFDNKFSEKVRLVWGARLEYFEQYLRAKDRSGKDINLNPEKYDLLPSFNLTINTLKRHNLRVAGSKTLSRPEFRELAPFQFFDYESNFGIAGDINLQRTAIYNADLRYEIYPKAGEAFTFGVFYKHFQLPIEFKLDPGSNADRRVYVFSNAKDADTYGAEVELRKNLDFLNEKSNFLGNTVFFANASYLFSQVRFNEAGSFTEISSSRPVQGQSPYLINTGLQYTNTEKGWSSSILYNRIGPRLGLVGNVANGIPDIYERPRDLFDFQIAKRVMNKKGEFKLTVSDILSQKIFLYENIDKNKNWKSGVDRMFSSYSPGSTISIGFTYDFDLK